MAGGRRDPDSEKITAIMSKGAKRFRDFHLNSMIKHPDKNGNGDAVFKGVTQPVNYPKTPENDVGENPRMADMGPFTWAEGYERVNEELTDEEAEEIFYRLVNEDPEFVKFIAEYGEQLLSEDFEQIDEISKGLANRYATAANKNLSQNYNQMSSRKRLNRQKGIKLALDKEYGHGIARNPGPRIKAT